VSNKDPENLNRALRGLREYFDNRFNNNKSDSTKESNKNASKGALSNKPQSKILPNTQKKEELKSKPINDKQDKNILNV